MLAPGVTGTTTSLRRLWLHDFRCFHAVDVAFAPGLTLVHGANAQGKTSLLESVAWIARGQSFRGVTDTMLVRAGVDQAIVRAEVVTGERVQLFEAEIRSTGRNVIRCNTQPVTRRRDLHGLLRVTVFAPDDLDLVKEGPATRRQYLDELLSSLAARHDATRADYERVVRQRNALLRGGMRDELAHSTLEVFDDQLVKTGTALVRARLELVGRLQPVIEGSYGELAGNRAPIGVSYEAGWAGGPVTTDDDPAALAGLLTDALHAHRRAELDRRVTLVGPHRDEIRLAIGGLDARTQASQGEQRTLALALRLAGHHTVTGLTGTTPLLLLDDVFSELDASRADALVRTLPSGQTLVTTAGTVPDTITPDQRLWVHAGRVDAALP